MPDLPAGPELDRLVKIAVGWLVEDRFAIGNEPRWISKVDRLPRPSVNVMDAIEALEATGLEYDIWRARNPEDAHAPYHVEVTTRDSGFVEYLGCAQADTLPHAAALAIVRWGKARDGKRNA